MTKTQFVPTTGINELSNYYLVQLMIKERIRSLLLGMPFGEAEQKTFALSLVQKYLDVPPELQPDIKKHTPFFKAEAESVVKGFEYYEKNYPQYTEALTAIKTMEGKPFSVPSVTISGLMVLIEV